MRHAGRFLSLCLGASACTSIGWAADSATSGSAAEERPALVYGYDVPGQVHVNAPLSVRSIVWSGQKTLDDRDGAQVNELTYSVCNIDEGDRATKRKPRKLYFQWPDAGFRTAVQGEVPFEECYQFKREVTAAVKQRTSDLLYTYDATAIPALRIWVMDWVLPWTKPAHYFQYAVSLYRDTVKGMKAAQKTFGIRHIKKSPKDPWAYQTLGWTQGTELYLSLPKLTPEELDSYRTSLGRLEEHGVTFSIRSAQAVAQDFQSEDLWVIDSFQDRDVLKVSLAPNREKDGEYREFDLKIPSSTVELVKLSTVLRQRASGRALYQAMYVMSGP